MNDNDETEWERREREDRERSLPPKEVKVNHTVEHQTPADPRSPEEFEAEARYNRECRRADQTLQLASALMVHSVLTLPDKGSMMIDPATALDFANRLHIECEALFEKPCNAAWAKLVAARAARVQASTAVVIPTKPK